MFHYHSILDQIDIAKGAFFQDNSPFVLVASSEKHPHVLQIINRQMAEETKSEDEAFGLSLFLEFDVDEPDDADAVKRLKQHKNFGLFIQNKEENLHFFTLLLPHDSEKAAALCSSILIETFGNKTQDNIECEFYELEEDESID